MIFGHIERLDLVVSFEANHKLVEALGSDLVRVDIQRLNADSLLPELVYKVINALIVEFGV